MTKNPLLELRALGQSVWLDDISRSLLTQGTLARLIAEDGLAGLTSNPAILSSAIMKGEDYGEAIKQLLKSDLASTGVYETLVIEDLQRAADLFRPLYDAGDATDGFVSMEVSPHLATDTAGSSAEAQRLWGRLARPNMMIKIPGTQAGLPAIRDTIASGINVNITLLFSPERYRAVAQAFLEGLEARVARGQPVARIASVASFFLSRIDSQVDALLDAKVRSGQAAAQALRGRAAVACAARAYEIFKECTRSPRWQALAARGARPQRLLWASTSTKDPTYSPVKYVEELIAPQTVTTVPRATLDEYRRIGHAERRLEKELSRAAQDREAFARLGIDLEATATQLEKEGVQKFVEPFDKLQAWLEERRRS